jgi:hypothetical protein
MTNRNIKELVALESAERYLDRMLDEYVNWREACVAVAASYENWTRADVGLRDDAFKAYAAALDREEQVARRYRLAVEQVLTTRTP